MPGLALVATSAGVALLYGAARAPSWWGLGSSRKALLRAATAVLGGAVAAGGLERFGAFYGGRAGLLVWLSALLACACLIGIAAPLWGRRR